MLQRDRETLDAVEAAVAILADSQRQPQRRKTVPTSALAHRLDHIACASGQSTITAKTDDTGTGPAHRESFDRARLSPMTKTESAGTVTAANRRGPQ